MTFKPTSLDLFRPRTAGTETGIATSAAPGPAAEAPLTVGALTRQLKGAVEARFARVVVAGELSNLTRPASGHLYFTLKDAEASLSAVMWRSQAGRLRFQPTPGMQLVARGRLTVYPPRGQYQLECDSLELAGEGALAAAFERLRERLKAEGLFDPARKRPVPAFPRRIGVVTSPTGAAIRDLLRLLHDRMPTIQVVVAGARVQGEGAADDLVAALKRLERWSQSQPEGQGLDVVVLTRGGGSLEDLWPFNEERVARAIAACSLPTVSAVGHEIDFTIADFVADLRAPTPTAAAERLAPVEFEERQRWRSQQQRLVQSARRVLAESRGELQVAARRLGDPRRELGQRRLALGELESRLRAAMDEALGARTASLKQLGQQLQRGHPAERLAEQRRRLQQAQQGLERRASELVAVRRAALLQQERRLEPLRPTARIAAERGRLVTLEERLQGNVARLAERERLRLARAAASLDALSPLRVLTRGYAIAFKEGRAVRSVAELSPGDALTLRVGSAGRVEARVEQVVPGEEGS